MERNTVLLQDTEAFMHGELDNVTVQQNCIVLDLVQGGYVPYGCYTSAPIPMPLFDALRVSWNAASPEDTAVEAQARVMVDGKDVARLRRGKVPFLRRQMGIIFQDFRGTALASGAPVCTGKARPTRRAAPCSAGLTACSLTANTPRRCSCASTFTPKMRR